MRTPRVVFVLVDFSGISPVSNETCTIVAILDTLHLPGETESGSAGTQPDKGYPGLRCANGMHLTPVG